MSGAKGLYPRAVRGRISGLPADLLVLLFLSVPAILPLTGPGFLWGHDFEDPPWRSLAIARALAEGILYPRWSADLYAGYGFPIFNFYAPLSYYPAAILSLTTPIGILTAAKMTFAAALFSSAAGAYLLARQLLRHRGAALLAGILYLYSPAVIGDVYVRSNLPGSASMAMIPFVLSSFVRLLDRPTLALSGVTSLLLAALILTHNINSAIGIGILIVFAIFHYGIRKNFSSLPLVLLATSLGIGLAAFFWLPAAAEMGLTHGASYDLRPHYVDPLGGNQGMNGGDKYDQTNWGPFDLHPLYPYGDPPYKLGLIQGILFLATGVLLLLSRKRPTAVLSLYASALLLFYGHTTWSLWLWDAIPASKLIEFPWRLIRPAGLPLAVSAAWTILQLAPRWRGWLIPSLGAASIISSMAMAPLDMKPFPFGPITPEGVVEWQAKAPTRIGTQVQGQFLPLTVDEGGGFSGNGTVLLRRYSQSFPPQRWAAETAFLGSGANGWVLATRKGQNWMQAEVEAGEPTTVAFHAIYFAGWTAYVDGIRTPIEPSSWTEYEEHRTAALGVIQVQVPAGIHLVTLAFEDTPIRALANWLSRLSLVLAIVLLAAPPCHPSHANGRRRFLLVLVVAVVGVVVVSHLLTEATAPGRGRDWVKNTTVFDLLADAERRRLELATPPYAVPIEAERNRLVLTAPEGRTAEDFIHTGAFNIDGDNRPVLFMHPPSSASEEVWIPEGARLEYTVAMDPGAWDKTIDGVEFRVSIREGDQATPILTRRVNPRSRPQDRGWLSGTADLARFAGRRVEIVLSTDPVASADYDWAGWAAARVVIN